MTQWASGLSAGKQRRCSVGSSCTVAVRLIYTKKKLPWMAHVMIYVIQSCLTKAEGKPKPGHCLHLHEVPRVHFVPIAANVLHIRPPSFIFKKPFIVAAVFLVKKLQLEIYSLYINISSQNANI